MRKGEEEESKDRRGEDGGGRGPSMREMKGEKRMNRVGRKKGNSGGGRWGLGVIVLTSMKCKHDSC